MPPMQASQSRESLHKSLYSLQNIWILVYIFPQMRISIVVTLAKRNVPTVFLTPATLFILYRNDLGIFNILFN